MRREWLVTLIMMLRERWSARRDDHVRFLKLQIEILRSRLPGNRVVPDPVERRRLLQLGARVDHRVEHTLGIVNIKTYRRWVREARDEQVAGKAGRPRMPKSLRKLIVRFARENPSWGTRRILGELKKLAVRTSRSSIRRVLVDEMILPDPDRHAPKGVETPWRKFIAIHMNVIVACDFFCQTIWTPFGRKTAYTLAFIHLASRRVFVSPATFNPTAEWVQQQARNVSMWAEDEGIDIRFLIHDRDTKFTRAFDAFFKRPDGGAIKTPHLAPIANCYAESWIGHMKRECLNHFFCFSLRHLNHIVHTYAMYYNTYRPHQGLNNRPLTSPDSPSPENPDVDIGKIQRQHWLGSLLTHYERKAA